MSDTGAACVATVVGMGEAEDGVVPITLVVRWSLGKSDDEAVLRVPVELASKLKWGQEIHIGLSWERE